jgi:hypothetical protein
VGDEIAFSSATMSTPTPPFNKTDTGNGSYDICRVINSSRAPSPNPKRFSKKMRSIQIHLVFIALVSILPSCVMYRSFDRHVRIWNNQSGKSARHEEFRYNHATPWPHFPRNPDPVRVELDDQGKRLVRLPGAIGWIGFGDFSAMIQGSEIRDGGTFDLYTNSATGAKESPWKVQISSPSALKKNRESGRSGD